MNFMNKEILNPAAKVDGDMVEGLQAFYSIISHDWRDSRGECSEVSAQLARQFGLLYVEGKFRLDTPLMSGTSKLEEDHAWCVDGNQRIVDLTAEQFNEGLSGNPIPKGVMIISNSDELFGRYRPERLIIKRG